MASSNPAPAHIKLFWKPGCSSCLRTKEFLIKQGIEYESVNAEDNPAALEELRALGARGLPVISLGQRFTLCQSFGDVLKFLDLDCGSAIRCRPRNSSPSSISSLPPPLATRASFRLPSSSRRSATATARRGRLPFTSSAWWRWASTQRSTRASTSRASRPAAARVVRRRYRRLGPHGA